MEKGEGRLMNLFPRYFCFPFYQQDTTNPPNVFHLIVIQSAMCFFTQKVIVPYNNIRGYSDRNKTIHIFLNTRLDIFWQSRVWDTHVIYSCYFCFHRVVFIVFQGEVEMIPLKGFGKMWWRDHGVIPLNWIWHSLQVV